MLACFDQVRGGCFQRTRNRGMHVGHHEAEPRRGFCNVSQSTSHGFGVRDDEAEAPLVPGVSEDGDCTLDIFQGGCVPRDVGC